ncbi:topology modulation protein [Sporosarcina sp. E16_8]|uniref:topology modulation protein n=1 Tax=Sporosarcina sp. E16_8 TaxID=2789295 RepID=UPI001A924928|nr:topology modulation protein [Sporosarcina sp. E16_8]MBO0586673.1 topology modulation protein [Sporosarcina sp. E16_8]
MNKIMVIGVSAGAGKSTFARRLGELTGIEVTHLDCLYWKPNWVEAPPEEFSASQQQVVQNDQWIIEGNYTGTFTIRESYADTVIYLELPLRVCLYRVLKRRVQFHGKTRNDIAEGCKEKIDKAFLKFILTTYGPRKKTMIERMQRYIGEEKTVHYLKSSKQIELFLKTYKKSKANCV